MPEIVGALAPNRLKQYHSEIQQAQALREAAEEAARKERAALRETALAEALGRRKMAELQVGRCLRK